MVRDFQKVAWYFHMHSSNVEKSGTAIAVPVPPLINLRFYLGENSKLYSQ